MEVLYHGIKTRYAYDFPLCFPHELLMSLRRIFHAFSNGLIAVIALAQLQNFLTNPFHMLIYKSIVSTFAFYRNN